MTAWTPGETIVAPGPRIRITNFGEPQPVGTIQGVVGALLRATWGPLNQAASIDTLADVDDTYGSGLGTDAVREALRGQARTVQAVRVGTGGVLATRTLTDDAALNSVRIDARYVGTRGNALALTLRDSLTDATRRELLVYEVVAGAYTLRETITFLKGDGNTEPAGLVAAVTASGSQWITATLLAPGSNVLAAVGSPTPVALASGVDPTTTGAEYTAALAVLELQDFNVAVLDTNDQTIAATFKAWLDRLRNEGKRVMGVLGEPTSVAFATRIVDSAAHNDPALVYVANGFIGSDGVTREGYLAAARVAGMIASAPVTRSLTYAQVANATSVVGALSKSDVDRAINAGALVFTLSTARVPRIEYGVTTFVTATASLDAGWKKIRRTRTRDSLLNRVHASWEPLIGQVNNDATGRAALRAVAQTIINQMVGDGALLSGRIYDDPARPPAGDIYYAVLEVDDLDSAEKLLLTAAFRYAPPATA